VRSPENWARPRGRPDQPVNDPKQCRAGPAPNAHRGPRVDHRVLRALARRLPRPPPLVVRTGWLLTPERPNQPIALAAMRVRERRHTAAYDCKDAKAPARSILGCVLVREHQACGLTARQVGSQAARRMSSSVPDLCRGWRPASGVSRGGEQPAPAPAPGRNLTDRVGSARRSSMVDGATGEALEGLHRGKSSNSTERRTHWCPSGPSQVPWLAHRVMGAPFSSHPRSVCRRCRWWSGPTQTGVRSGVGRVSLTPVTSTPSGATWPPPCTLCGGSAKTRPRRPLTVLAGRSPRPGAGNTWAGARGACGRDRHASSARGTAGRAVTVPASRPGQTPQTPSSGVVVCGIRRLP